MKAPSAKIRRNRLGKDWAVLKASAAGVELAPSRAVMNRSRARPMKRLTRVRLENTMDERIRPPFAGFTGLDGCSALTARLCDGRGERSRRGEF